MTEWPQMDKGRPASWNQPPGQPAPAQPQPRPGDPSIVDASQLPAPAVASAPPAEPAPRRCLECGGEVDADGYCQSCGAKAPTEREHFEQAPSDWLGAVCDKGLRHARNEDALAVACDEPAGSRAALVVCDGVTTSDASDVASLAAAEAACDLLGEARPERMGTPASRSAAVVAALTKAAAVANDAVAASTPAGASNPAACTFAAAYVADGHIYAGNVGDSRVYVFPDEGEAVQLSTDDSLAAEGIAAGVSRKEAEEAADAHTITRWLGVDGVDVIPHVAAYGVAGPTWLLVCSDGLWNYASAPADLAAVLAEARKAAEAAGAASPVDIARQLVKWANAQGGHDNISACLARVGVAPPEQTPVEADDDIPTAKIQPERQPEAPAPTASAAEGASVEADAPFATPAPERPGTPEHPEDAHATVSTTEPPAPDAARAVAIDDEPTVEMEPIPAAPGTFEPPQLGDPAAPRTTDAPGDAPIDGAVRQDAEPTTDEAAPAASDDYDPITHERVAADGDVRKDGPHGDV